MERLTFWPKTMYERLMMRAYAPEGQDELQEYLANHPDPNIRFRWASLHKEGPQTSELYNERIKKETHTNVLSILGSRANFEQRKTLMRRKHAQAALAGISKKETKPGEALELIGMLIEEHGKSSKNIISANLEEILPWVETLEPQERSTITGILLERSLSYSLAKLISKDRGEHLNETTERLLGLDYSQKSSVEALKMLIMVTEPGHPNSRLKRIKKKLSPQDASMLQWWIDPKEEPQDAEPWFELHMENFGMRKQPKTERQLLGGLLKEGNRLKDLYAWVETQKTLKTQVAIKILEALFEYTGATLGPEGLKDRLMLSKKTLSEIIAHILERTQINEFTKTAPDLAESCIFQILRMHYDTETLKPLSYQLLKSNDHMAGLALLLFEEIQARDAAETFNALEENFTGTLGELLNAIEELGPQRN